MKNKISIIFAALLLPLLFSCQSLRHPAKKLSRNLIAQGQLSPEELSRFFLSQNPAFDQDYIYMLACLYYDEALCENINSDVAFAQMCLETGYLNYGNLVQPEWHNYCGLGAIDKEHPGEIFESEEVGVRAHIQHLQAYATKEDVPLVKELVDPRYNWVHKTKFVEDIFGLAGSWAADPAYGQKLDSILVKMEESTIRR